MPFTNFNVNSPSCLVEVSTSQLGSLNKVSGFVGASSSPSQSTSSLNGVPVVGGMTVFRTYFDTLKVYPYVVGVSSNSQLCFSAVDKRIAGHHSKLTETPSPTEWYKVYGDGK